MQNIPALAQNIGIALVTLLIPIAIALLQDREFDALDKNVILDHIVRSKDIIVFLAFIFITPFFWEISNLSWRIFEVLVWSAGVAFMVNVLARAYEWIKGDKFPHRLSYLDESTAFDDQEESWKSIWAAKDINSQNEQELTYLFIKKIDALAVSPKDRAKAARLLEDYLFNIELRQPFTLCMGEDSLYAKVLEWYKGNRVAEEEILGKGEERDNDLWSKSSYLSRTIRNMLKRVEELSIERDDFYNFITPFRKHLEGNKDLILRDNYPYIKDLFSWFYPVFFEKVPENDYSFNVFYHYFPKEWTVTLSNLDSPTTSEYAIYSVNEFFEWARPRIWRDSEEWDKHLDVMIDGIFPDVDPITFAPILMCVFNYHLDIQPIIEKGWKFGLVGRSVSLDYVDERDDGKEFSRKYKIYEENSIKLALRLFGNRFNLAQTDEIVKQAKSLRKKYEKDSKEYRRTIKLENIFSAMKSELNAKSKKS
jgi:hypothetical protein